MEPARDPTPQPAISTQGLTKIFRDFWGRPKVVAVDRIDLEVRPGEIFGLLGPNGSGKSTTLKMILGLLHPSAGSLSVLGRSPRDVHIKSRIGYMPEESYLYRYLTAEETLHFYGKLLALPAVERTSRVEQLLTMTGLQAARHRAVGEFSKGMARRVGLAQSLLNDPDLLLLDEPTSGLDPVACRQVKNLLLALVQRGKTILVCSHRLADMEDVCHRVAILCDGRLCAQGAVRDLLRQPDACRITFPALSPERLHALLDRLRAETEAEPSVDHPSQSLEDYFVDTVAAVRGAGHRETAGALDAIAPFLSGSPPPPTSP